MGRGLTKKRDTIGDAYIVVGFLNHQARIIKKKNILSSQLSYSPHALHIQYARALTFENF